MTSEDPARQLERSRGIRGGHHGVVTKFVQEAETVLGNESLTSEQRSRLRVIRQQLDGKLKTLKDLDQKILDLCEPDVIENEVEGSEAIIAKILDCKLKIEGLSVASLLASVP